MPRPYLLLLLPFLALAACDSADLPEGDTSQFPQTDKDRRKERLGKLTGEEGMVLSGPDDKRGEEGNNPLGVNSFLWRATLDTLSFMPFASADPFGGVVLTDWFEDPKTPGERFKVNALILDRQLRADSIRISVFKQKRDSQPGKALGSGEWKDTAVPPSLARKLEDAILTRARELRVGQLGY
jgi:hypothetical protein